MNAQDLLREADDLAEVGGLNRWTALVQVMLTRLATIALPTALEPTLELAVRYWSGEPEDLDEARAQTWEYLRGSFPDGRDVSSVKGRAVRALICVLYPDGDDEFRSETAEWFVAMTEVDKP